MVFNIMLYVAGWLCAGCWMLVAGRWMDFGILFPFCGCTWAKAESKQSRETRQDGN